MNLNEAKKILNKAGFVLNERMMTPAQRKEFSKLWDKLPKAIERCLSKMDFVKKFNYDPAFDGQSLTLVLKYDADPKEVTEYVFQELNNTIYDTVAKTPFVKDAIFTPEKDYYKMVNFSLTKQASNRKDGFWSNDISIKISLRFRGVSEDGRTMVFSSKGKKASNKYSDYGYFPDAG